MRVRTLQVVLLLIALLFSACLGQGPRGPNDDGDKSRIHLPRFSGPPLAEPLKDGSHSYTIKEYDEGTMKVGGKTSAHKDYSYDARLRGVLFVPNGDGPFPVLVFLHGMHQTCGFGEREAPAQPPTDFFGRSCQGPEPWHPYPNHRGYDYLGKHLASHGFIVASILGKEVNDRNGNPDVGMWARGELVIGTLDLLKAANAGDKDLGIQGKLDLTSIGLMGHSRGGEGVVMATHVNAERSDPYRIGAVIPLAPTDFNRRGVQDAALLSLVPYCDGDVFSLHGLRTYDQSRHLDDGSAKIQVLVFGANHNNYNTQWGKGEIGGVVRDGDDAQPGRHMNPDCDLNRAQGGGRLTTDDTLREGLLHMAGFFRWVLLGEHALAPYFMGEAPMPSSTCPAKAASCPDAVRISALLPGRRWAFNVTENGVLKFGAQDVRLVGFDSANPCTLNRCAANVYSSAWSLSLWWSKKATLTADLPPDFLVGHDVLAFRAGVPTQGDSNKAGQLVDLSVVLVEADGTRHSVAASAHSRALMHPPGELVDPAQANLNTVGSAKVSLNMVRIPLSAFDVDPSKVRAVELSFDKTPSGRLLLSELYAQPETRLAFAPQ